MSDYYLSLIILFSSLLYIAVVTKVTLWIYRRGLNDKKLLPTYKEVARAILDIVVKGENIVETKEKIKKKLGHGRYKN